MAKEYWCDHHWDQWHNGSLLDERDRRDSALKRYNLTGAGYNCMLSDQNYVCAICSKPPGKRALAVDHDHQCCDGSYSCGKCIRGLLCTGCNTRLGFLEANDGWLALAVAYVARHSRVP